ncbi:MAG: hypothetical protein ACO3Q3_07750 [Flavobacteriaceae bacterium]
MKKLYLAFTLILIGLYSCSTSAEQPDSLKPIEQLQAYVKNNTGCLRTYKTSEWSIIS